MNMSIMLDKDYRIKCIPHPRSEFKNFLLYHNKRELYTYKFQKRFLHFFWKTLDRSYSLIRMYKCYNLELSGQELY